MKPHVLVRLSWSGAVLAALCLGTSGCRTGGEDDGHDAQVRLINAAAGTEELAVAVDGRRVWKHSAFRSSTGYGGVKAGTYPVTLEARRGGQLLSSRAYFVCAEGHAYTVLALSGAGEGAPEMRIFSEDRDAPIPGGKARVRFVNAVAGAHAQDMVINNIAALTDVPPGSRSRPLLLEPGAYDVKVDAAGDADALVGPTNLRFQAGHAYTLISMGRAGADAADPQQGVSLEMYPDDKSGGD